MAIFTKKLFPYRTGICILVLFFVASLFFASVRYLTDGFSPDHITHHNNSLQTKESHCNQDVISLLSQKFFYLGKGSQCYVFESEDRQYILKFFRFPRYRTFCLSDYFLLPCFYREIEKKKALVKQQKLESLFDSCKIAYEELADESGLIYLHLNKTKDIELKVQCYDKLHRPFVVDMDQTPFLLQKRAELVYPYLAYLLKKNKKEDAKKALSELLQILHLRLEKGIFDGDAVISKNAGFYLGHAMFIDTGQFKKDTRYQNPKIAAQEMDKVTRKLSLWLKEKDMDLSLFFEEKLSQNYKR